MVQFTRSKSTGATRTGAQQPQTIRAQLGWSLTGSSVVFACIVVTCIVWLINFKQTNEAMSRNSSQFRREQARLVNMELANILRPLFTVAQSFAIQQDHSLGDLVADPRTYQDLEGINQLQPIFFSKTDRRSHIRSMKADGSDRRLNNFVGVAAVIVLDENDTLTSDLGRCSHAVLTSQTLDSPDPSSNLYNVDFQKLNASAPGGVDRRLYRLNTDRTRVGNVVVPMMPPISCATALGPLLRGYSPPGFRNFTWFGPHPINKGWGSHFVGSVPIYDSNQGVAGRLSAVISLGKSVGPLLQDIIRQGGSLTQGGQGAVFTEEGFVIGLSEAAASPTEQQVLSITEVLPGSETGLALAILQKRFGTACPSTQELVTAEDRLVDVTPFQAESYGLAPLGKRWCQMILVPRQNVFEPIDRAATSGLAVGTLMTLGLLSALGMLARSLFLTMKAHLQVVAEKRRNLQKRVEEADLSVHNFGTPMALLQSSEFLVLESLVCYEVLRDQGKLRFIDSEDQVAAFKSEGNAIVFISHQWLGFAQPDTADGVQLQAMQRVVEQLLKYGMRNLYVWLDFISVAQSHVGQMRLAVNSLPAYVSVADYFVICAPDAVHRDTGQECNLDSYSRRGWCRTEMFAKACSTGLAHMYICCNSGEKLKPYSSDDFGKVSLKVFEGDFTFRTDMEVLVEPVLGLYGQILQHTGLPHIDMVREHVNKDKEAFFPSYYAPDKDHPSETRVLFGPLICTMEEYIKASTGTSPPVQMEYSV